MPFTQEMELNPELWTASLLPTLRPADLPEVSLPPEPLFLGHQAAGPLRPQPPQQWPSLALHGSQGRVTQGDKYAE